MNVSWKDSIYLQREELARILREPLAQLAGRCTPAWGDREALDAILLEGFSGIPHCSFLYCLGIDGIQISNNVGHKGIVAEHLVAPPPSWWEDRHRRFDHGQSQSSQRRRGH